MKITYCARDWSNFVGGSNSWLSRLLPVLRRRGIESRVLCFTLSPGEQCPTVRSLRKAGIDCVTVPEEEMKYTEQRVRWILERVAENPPDVFVPDYLLPAYYAGRWIREAGIPTVGICPVPLNVWVYPGILDQFVFGSSAYQVSAFACVSKYLEQSVLEQHPKGVLVSCIPHGVPIPKDVAQKPNGRLRLAYVGRLIERAKRISEVTRSLCRAVREVPGTEAVIYGDGPERPTVERILREEGDGLPVRLYGWVDSYDIQRHLLGCHALVLLSDHEGLPLSVMEGMACGLVPIGLRGTSGVTELVEDNITGFLVNDRSDGFVTAVRRLREDAVLWDRLARSARAKVEAEYSLEVCATRWQELCEKLANCSGPRKPLRIPRRLNLPPVHPALGEDNRIPHPYQRLIQPVKRFMSHVKYQYPSIFGPQ